MLGPDILARTLSRPTSRGSGETAWQYHSRSDTHSKVACWVVVFDLLRECPVFAKDCQEGRIALAINHVMVGRLNKTLDLVICEVPRSRNVERRRTFADLVGDYDILLDKEERSVLDGCPRIPLEGKQDISEVLVALEAKACMTEHHKSIPRLHAEILATGFLAKQAAKNCITVSYSLVNAANTFITPSAKGKVNEHTQPKDANAVVNMLRSAIPNSSEFPSFGYDAVGVTVIDCANDGSPVMILHDRPAPSHADHVHYDRMIRNICSEYRAKFA